MVFYDLNVCWIENQIELQKTVAFLSDCLSLLEPDLIHADSR